MFRPPAIPLISLSFSVRTDHFPPAMTGLHAHVSCPFGSVFLVSGRWLGSYGWTGDDAVLAGSRWPWLVRRGAWSSLVSRRQGDGRGWGDDAVTPRCLGWYVGQFQAPVISDLSYRSPHR